jgi:predicted DsbA family dithiol-disulfide isomerase
LKLLAEQRPDVKPAVRWLPFQLNPDLPAEGIPRVDYIARKFGTRGKGNYDRVAKVGESVGIPFAFDKIEVQPNTLNAHRLLTYAEHQGRQHEVAEVLFNAYFIEGANITDVDTLAAVAQRGGLDEVAAKTYLASDADRDAVANADLEARNAGIGGVPFFIFNRAVAVSGAHEPETLLQAMLQSMQERKAANG